jgi:SAM-dependent methyltransferase
MFIDILSQTPYAGRHALTFAMTAYIAAPQGHQGLGEPSEWLVRYAHLLPANAHVLDVACGAGRHVRWLTDRGFVVTALDRNADALAALESLAPQVTICRADIEDAAWPLADQQFDAVLVTHYLHRPLWAALIGAVAPGGLMIYETFAAGNEQFGKPSRPDFLLNPGELLDAVKGSMRVVAYEDRYVDQPKPAMIQRIVARKNN